MISRKAVFIYELIDPETSEARKKMREAKKANSLSELQRRIDELEAKLREGVE